MLAKTFFAAALAAGTATAAALPMALPQAKAANVTSKAAAAAGSFQQVVYWGQNNAERSLGEYCDSQDGIDVLVLSFVYSFGNGAEPTGNFGETCATQWNCTDVAADIQKCKAAGKKVFLSLGGAASNGQVANQADGQDLADKLWNRYGNPAFSTDTTAHRPLGDQFVDGFDLDIEFNLNNANDNYKYLVQGLRSNFARDTGNTYYISGAPQCPIPEPNMGQMIQDAKFDLLFIQFYNNPDCSANNYRDGPKQNFNFDSWVSYTAQGQSAGAKLFVGLPASTLGATGTASGAKYYLEPNDLASLINEYKSHPSFSGVMLWDAHNSDTINQNGCSYSGEVRSILDKGTTC